MTLESIEHMLRMTFAAMEHGEPLELRSKRNQLRNTLEDAVYLDGRLDTQTYDLMRDLIRHCSDIQKRILILDCAEEMESQSLRKVIEDIKV